jgi:hypothetical protein
MGLGNPESYDKSSRRIFLQFIATDWARRLDPDVFVKKMYIRLQQMNMMCPVLFSSKECETNLFISDVRFPNEFHMLRNNGFILVKINRDEALRVAAGAVSLDHKSETLLDAYPDEAFDYVIDNNGTFKDFYFKIDEMLNYIGVQK